jgi:hypothetical protein
MHKVLLALVAAVALLSVASSSASTQTQQNGAFRADLVQLYTNLAPIAAGLDQNSLAGAPADRSAVLGAATAKAKSLSPAQLAVMKQALSAYPSWRSLPTTLAKLVARLPKGRFSTAGVKITPDDCPTARAAGFTQTDVEAAADASLAADAILEAIPQDTLDEVVRAVAVGLWAIPQGIQRAFEHLYNIANACDAADQQALITTNLDAKVSSRASVTDVNTRASQVSVDNLTTIVQNAITNITSSFTSIENAITALKTDVDTSFVTVNTALTTLKTDVDNSFTAVNTAIANVQTGVNTANTRLVTLTANVAANNDLNIRLHIEEDLANPGNHPIALFELPAAQGGYLEVARSIVADIIAKMTTNGEGAGNGASFLASGDQSRAAGQFKAAYASYGKAYQAAAK